MEAKQILEQIDALKSEADNLQPTNPDLERIFWDKFRLEFNYNSNHMEGNTLTYGHTQILLKSGDVVGKYNIRELQEMKAHDLALKVILESADDSEFRLSQKFIKEINQTILVEPFYSEAITPEGNPTQKLITPGQYKRTPNSVRLQNGEMFYYPSPEETPALMADLIDWYEKESENNELHPVQLAALFHYKIVRIHPFDDSNGRTSRLLMNYTLLRNGYAPLVINSSDKKNYLIALNEADAGDIEAFVKYIISLQLHWQEIYLKALKGQSIEEPDDFEKEVKLLKQKISEKEDKLELLFNDAPFEEIFKTSILPLLNALIHKLNLFDDFFFKRSIILYAPSIGIWNDVAPANIPIILEAIRKGLASSNRIEFRYICSNLKREKDHGYSYETNLNISFSEINYEISSTNLPALSIRKFYHRNLSSDEIDMVSKLLAKQALVEIKNFIEG